MFGHQDDKHDDDNDDNKDESRQDAVTATGVAPDQPGDDAQDTGQTDQGQDDQSAADDNSPSPGADSGDDNAWQHPGEPIDDNPEQISDIITPAGGHQSGSVPSMPTPPRDFTGGDNDEANVPHELIDIKQKALTQLSPLMGQLDLNPEDKFRTTMMMIQASDDQSLVKQAYDAANGIEDEKLRAQALLDIVNEITYFTQHPASDN